jgi:hypothetical protein
MIDKLEKKMEGRGTGLSEIPSRHLAEGLNQTTKSPVKVAGVRDKIRTERNPNTNLHSYCYTDLFGEQVIEISCSVTVRNLPSWATISFSKMTLLHEVIHRITEVNVIQCI